MNYLFVTQPDGGVALWSVASQSFLAMDGESVAEMLENRVIDAMQDDGVPNEVIENFLADYRVNHPEVRDVQTYYTLMKAAKVKHGLDKAMNWYRRLEGRLLVLKSEFYQAEDGTKFKTAREAEEHSLKIRMYHELEFLMMMGGFDNGGSATITVQCAKQEIAKALVIVAVDVIDVLQTYVRTT